MLPDKITISSYAPDSLGVWVDALSKLPQTILEQPRIACQFARLDWYGDVPVVFCLVDAEGSNFAFPPMAFVDGEWQRLSKLKIRE